MNLGAMGLLHAVRIHTKNNDVGQRAQVFFSFYLPWASSTASCVVKADSLTPFWGRKWPPTRLPGPWKHSTCSGLPKQVLIL